MFQSVVHPSAVGGGRFGTGVWVSLLVHVGVFGGAWGLSAHLRDAAEKEPEIALVFRPPAPARGPSVQRALATPARPASPVRPAPRPRRHLFQPLTPRPAPEPRPEPPPEAPPDEGPADPGPEVPSSPGENPGGALTGVVCPDCPVGLGPTGPGDDEGEEVVRFGAGMTPPRLLSEGVPVRYTTEALRERVQGLLVAQCTLSREGTVRDCHIIKGLPYLDASVLESLVSRRYAPVTFQGKAVNALYTFNVRLRMP